MGEHMRAEVREYLAERDVPCPRCRYNLRGLQAVTCPECGEHLTVQKLADSNVRLTPAWWVGLAPLLLIAVPSVPVIAIASVIGFSHVFAGSFIVAAAAMLVAMGAAWGLSLEVRWIRNAEKFVSMPKNQQWKRAWMSWALGGVFVLLLIVVGQSLPMWK